MKYNTLIARGDCGNGNSGCFPKEKSPGGGQSVRRPRIPPMIADIVLTALSACDGVVFEERGACPVCGGAISGYDTKKKQFAVLADGEGRRPIHVFVRRFLCKDCKKVCFADEPFYPGTRVGSPVVDLCVTLSMTMPFTQTAVYLEEVGIYIDRMSVRNFVRRTLPPIATADVFGIRLPMSVVALSSLATSVSEGGRIKGAEALAACGFPSADRAPLRPGLPLEEGNERDKEHGKEEGQVRQPQDRGERE